MTEMEELRKKREWANKMLDKFDISMPLYVTKNMPYDPFEDSEEEPE